MFFLFPAIAARPSPMSTHVPGSGTLVAPSKSVTVDEFSPVSRMVRLSTLPSNPLVQPLPALNPIAPFVRTPLFGNAASTSPHVQGFAMLHVAFCGAPVKNQLPVPVAVSVSQVCQEPVVTVLVWYGSNTSRPIQALLASVMSVSKSSCKAIAKAESPAVR